MIIDISLELVHFGSSTIGKGNPIERVATVATMIQKLKDILLEWSLWRSPYVRAYQNRARSEYA